MNAAKSSIKTALVTGATSGLGAAIAARLSRENYAVYGTGRKAAERIGSEAPAGTPSLRFLSLDVQDEKSIAAVVAAILEREGRLDLLVACAGMGTAGAVEDSSMDDIAFQMDVNFLGTVRTVKACLGAMRAAGGGKIIVIGSLAGRTGMPFQAFYSASKFALAGFVESLRYEVRAFGIDVCILEPGDFSTGFTAARRKTATVSEAYREDFERLLALQERDEKTGASAERIADRVMALLGKKRLPPRASAGMLFQRAGLFLKRLMPGKCFEFIYRKYYKVD